MSESAPIYVTCHCQHCGGGIEFDANELTEENSIFPCPHCGLQTQLSIPKKDPIAIKPSTEQASPLQLQKRGKVSLKSPRVTLTKAQCGSPTGQALIGLLVEIGGDGIVTEEEVCRLHRWLIDNASTDIPAVNFLWRLSEGFLRDGKVTQDEAFEIQLALERVLPKDARSEIVEKRKEVRLQAWIHSPDRPSATEAQLDYIRGLGGTPPPGLNVSEASDLIEQLLENYTPPPKQYATEKQIKFIRDLGGLISPGLTKADASLLIQQLLGRQQPTPRQMMILRFWNRMDMARQSKEEVAAWLSEFYDENPRRKEAWELFKIENGDDGSQHDPSFVPLGAGDSYLNR